MRKLAFVLLLPVIFLPHINSVKAQSLSPTVTNAFEEVIEELECDLEDPDIVTVQGRIGVLNESVAGNIFLISGETDENTYLLSGEFFDELILLEDHEVLVCGFLNRVRANELVDNELEVVDYISVTSTITPSPTLTPAPRQDLTRESEQTIGPLENILKEQEIRGSVLTNPFKLAIRSAVESGVPPNTIVLLLLLPGVAALIAAARHLVGLRGFGIFIPAVLSVVFIATGPFVGIGLFLVIVFMSTLTRMVLRKTKIKLQYLPRMALLLWAVVVGILMVLFAAPIINQPALANVNIFPVLILVLLAEDFTRVQLGKSARTAVNITSETLILALVSYFVLTMPIVQRFALLHPEAWIISIAVFDLLVGRYVGLRVLELWRFRRLIKK